MKPGGRMRRVDESLREVIAESLRTLKDPRIGFATVTSVRTSSDLRQATVYVSVLGNARKRAATMAGLTSAHGYLQGRIGAELRLKRTPQLTFEYDPAIEEAMRLSQLIDELVPDVDDRAD